tara:strand:+ start:491 stop:664 length:174 start_codon:yes stop_codon:yes gene_type:complete
MTSLFKILWTIISFVFVLAFKTIAMIFGGIFRTQAHIGTFAVADYHIRNTKKYYSDI